MPRVTKATAAKDYPQHGIAKGDTYYHWSFFRGPKQYSKTPPKPSQLCNTVLSGAYAASEDLADAIDFLFVDHGSLCILYPRSEAAESWVEANVSPERQTWGQGGVVVEPRYAQEILMGITHDGLTIVN